MNPFRGWHWSTKWIASLGLLGSAVLWLFDDTHTAEVGRAASINSAAVASDEPAASRHANRREFAARQLSPLAHFSAMVERPLFVPSRRKPDAVIHDVDSFGDALAEGPNDPLVAFIGTIADGNGIRAMINGPQGTRIYVLGEEIEGWRILVIEARRLVLGQRAEHLELKILEPSS